MARNQRNATRQQSAPDTLPAGFKQVKPDRAKLFFLIEAGAVLQGILMGRYRSKRPGLDGQPRHYYHVKLTAPCTFLQEKTDEKDSQGKPVYNDAKGQAGDLVSFDEKADTAHLAQFADGHHELFLRVKGKENIGNGQTMWACAVGIREVADTDDVPF